MIYKLLVLMLIAHILGDFYFQTDKMASNKYIYFSLHYGLQ